MLYEAFTGGISAQTAATEIASRLAKAIPGLEAGAIARSLAYKINALINTTDGFQWSDLGSIIVDIGNFVLDFTPYATYGDIAAVLWSASNIL
ncbi:hypothetical protein [Salinicoccus carnicancri]|uniref:hypothetical protein n=1 Tax=Salinicoccus carnicancri TaxID=558170 RepID=UPI000360D743|nr:hypothetical protein [Salinicoccus carnicancri]